MDSRKKAVWAYHLASRLGYEPKGGDVLRWSTNPPILELEATEDAISLPRPGLSPSGDVFLSFSGDHERTPPPHSGGVLGTILGYGYGLVGAHRYPSGSLARRPAPSAGGLYPCTLVVATMGAGELPAGVFSYAPVEHVLVPSRLGEAAALAVRRTIGDLEPTTDPVFILVASYWRSAWKYQQRALRFCAQDAGHAAGALLCSIAGLDGQGKLLPVVDRAGLNDILGLDPATAGVMTALSVDLLGTAPVDDSDDSPGELIRPAVGGEPMGGATLAALSNWGQGELGTTSTLPPLPEGDSTPLPEVEPPGHVMALADCVLQRHSARRFGQRALTPEQLALLLAVAHDAPGGPLALGVAVQAVEGIEPGVYRYDADGKRLIAIRPGRIADELAAACDGQAFVGQAAITIISMVDLKATVDDGGLQAFLRSNVATGISGQHIYLASTALGLGCCAVGCFNDEEVEMLAGLDGPAESVLCMYSVGHLPAELDE